MDYQKVNSVTKRDAYPLPRIDATLDSLAGAEYFTVLDLASGYWQVEVEEDDKEKTAFSTPQGHFHFNVMPFGLTNAPATFQRLMECILAGLNPSHCLIYLDDIIVHSTTFSEHLERLASVLRQLRNAGLQLKPSKCKFAQKEVHYLGHIASAAGAQPDPSKTEAVSSYPVPRNVQEVRQFLGLANYYRQFIKHFSEITEPLHQLTRKTTKGFHWNPSCQSAFDELKRRLVSPPILAYPDFSLPFVLHTDASATVVGAVLCQIQNGMERVISYWSRQLNKAERNYSTIEREALAAVAAVKEFYPYLYGFPFQLVTDHNPLTALKGLKDVGGQLTRWMLYLQQFDYTIEYKSGRTHGDADSLSRRPDGNGGGGTGDGGDEVGNGRNGRDSDGEGKKDADCEALGGVSTGAGDGAGGKGVGWEGSGGEGAGGGDKFNSVLTFYRPPQPPDGYKGLNLSEAQLNDPQLKCLHEALTTEKKHAFHSSWIEEVFHC